MGHTKYHAITQAFLASLFFAASAPLAKTLLADIDPVMLAALLYLGCGVGLLVLKTAMHRIKADAEAHLSGTDMPWLLGAILAGGVVAPIVLLYSLRNTSAATASLLLNFEGVATSVIAAIMFREAIGKRVWIAVILVTIGSIILSWDRSETLRLSIGALGIIAACALWGLDNNLIRHISAKDPVTITIIKGIVAGIVSFGMALLLGNHLPGIRHIGMAVLLGFFAYGLSIVFFISALRHLGAARTSAYFGTAPFIGVLLSLVLLKEVPDASFMFAVPVMVAGAILLLIEKHEHTHIHEEFEHEHGHKHDDEHHVHDHEMATNGFYSHPHKHCIITHIHPHLPDIHHRHEH
ncbi:MAG: DMT family transporter [Anaerohalosphaeraceae bacterium]